MPNLTLAANLGLVLFLFLVGLEVDMRILFSNWKTAASVGALGMAFPFALGWWPLYLCGVRLWLFLTQAQVPLLHMVFTTSLEVILVCRISRLVSTCCLSV
jgi:Kef-type K+ transport system membrane component KefB